VRYCGALKRAIILRQGTPDECWLNPGHSRLAHDGDVNLTLAGISSENTKFCYVILQLDHQYATEVEDIITSALDQDPYTTLRTELVRRLPP
jgi:hypothetical protein